jgi:hypothetical protein
VPGTQVSCRECQALRSPVGARHSGLLPRVPGTQVSRGCQAPRSRCQALKSAAAGARHSGLVLPWTSPVTPRPLRNCVAVRISQASRHHHCRSRCLICCGSLRSGGTAKRASLEVFGVKLTNVSEALYDSFGQQIGFRLYTQSGQIDCCTRSEQPTKRPFASKSADGTSRRTKRSSLVRTKHSVRPKQIE